MRKFRRRGSAMLWLIAYPVIRWGSGPPNLLLIMDKALPHIDETITIDEAIL